MSLIRQSRCLPAGDLRISAASLALLQVNKGTCSPSDMHEHQQGRKSAAKVHLLGALLGVFALLIFLRHAIDGGLKLSIHIPVFGWIRFIA